MLDSFHTFNHKHSLEGLRIRCGMFFGVVKNGRCSECKKEIRIQDEPM